MIHKKKRYTKNEVKRIVAEWQDDNINTPFFLWFNAYVRAAKTVADAKEKCKEFGIFAKN